MPKTLIESNVSKGEQGFHKWIRLADSKFDINESLQVAEFFFDTIQGEGISTGAPSAFLRLKGCTLDCVWCDTAAVWREGDAYSFDELCAMMYASGLVDKLQKGQHLILTGGSPLKQQHELVAFIKHFVEVFNFKPYIEVENECVLMPDADFEVLIDQWNNSPKLANSEMKERARYKPLVLTHTARLKNSWFKFVVQNEEEWKEIEEMFIDTEFIKKEQVILMPCGEDQEELAITRPIAAEMAIKHGVRFCDRLHVTIWDRKTGV